MRSSEQFEAIWHELKWFVRFHNKPVWLVPLEDRYSLSVIRPEGKDLPVGTCSNLYDTNLHILDTVMSKQQ